MESYHYRPTTVAHLNSAIVARIHRLVQLQSGAVGRLRANSMSDAAACCSREARTTVAAATDAEVAGAGCRALGLRSAAS